MTQANLPVISPDEYMRRAPVPPGGNTPWASAYSYELQQVIKRQANRSPRNVQTTLGPSELGSPCDLEVVGKFAARPRPITSSTRGRRSSGPRCTPGWPTHSRKRT